MTVPGASARADSVRAALAVLGASARTEVPLGALTTYRVGGLAAIAVEVASVGDIEAVAAARAASGLPILVVGRGSNLLVADGGFDGIAVLLDPTELGRLEIEGSRVTAGAALPLPALARRTADAGLHGLEWAVGVPGSVGGGVRMNAGGHGSEISERLGAASVVDLAASPSATRRRSPPELCHGYRSSAVGATDVVLDATFDLTPGDIEEGRATIRSIVRWRRANQPGGQNAGSVFANPAWTDHPAPAVPHSSAGALVDAAGLKGHRIGTASVSEKHANFIQADPGGSAADIVAVMDHIRRVVNARFGVELRAEVRLVGFDGEECTV